MYNPEWEHPLELFSTQHLVALGVILAVILLLFFTRKFFMKYAIADRIARYTLATLLVFFELVTYFHHGTRSLFKIFIGSYPLCGLMVWLSAIALISDSRRLTKLFYPAAIIGALLSLFVVDMNCSFPHIRAFQFFFTHGCFLTGTLYFVFTRKISRYTLKDLKNSCIFLFGLSCWSLIITLAKRDGAGEAIGKLAGTITSSDVITGDPYFILNPPGELAFFKNALGQVGYTICFVIIIFAVIFAIYGITYLFTKKRTPQDEVMPNLKKNKILDFLSTVSTKKVILFFFFLAGITTYVTVLGEQLVSPALRIIDNILFFTLIISVILNEVVANYKKYVLKNSVVSSADEKAQEEQN